MKAFFYIFCHIHMGKNHLSCTITNHGKTVLKLRGTVCEMP